MGADGANYTFIVPKLLLDFLTAKQMKACMQQAGIWGMNG